MLTNTVYGCCGKIGLGLRDINVVFDTYVTTTIHVYN